MVKRPRAALRRLVADCRIFGLREWSKSPFKASLCGISSFPWSADDLLAPCPFHAGKTVAETHGFFFGTDSIFGEPLTLMRWQKLCPEDSEPRFHSYCPWFQDQLFAQAVSGRRWHALLLHAVAGRFDLPRSHELPSAVDAVAMHMLFEMKSGIRYGTGVSMLTRDVTQDCMRVVVGRTLDNEVDHGIDVGVWSADEEYAVPMLVGAGASLRVPPKARRSYGARRPERMPLEISRA